MCVNVMLRVNKQQLVKRCFSFAKYYKLIKKVKEDNFIGELNDENVRDGSVYYLRSSNVAIEDGFEWTLKSNVEGKNCMKYYYVLN